MNNPNITDVVIQQKAKDDFRDAVLRNCLNYIYLGVGVFIAGFLQATCLLTMCENLVNRLRRAFFHAVMRQEIACTSTPNLINISVGAIFRNLERVKEGTGDKIGLMISSLSRFFIGFIIAFTYSWKLTLIMMSLTPLVIITGLFVMRLLATATTEEAKKYAAAGGLAEEVLTSIRTVIAFNGQQLECEKYEAALRAGKITGIKKSFYTAIGHAVLFVIVFSSYCLAFWVGVDFIYKGEIDGATVMTVFFSVMMGAMSLAGDVQQFSVIGTAIGAATSLYEVIDREPIIDAHSSEGETPKSIDGRIQVKDVKFAYPSRPEIPILKGVSFEAKPGETVALVGASGCGKSTVIQLLQRFYDPIPDLFIDGIAIEKFNTKYLRRLIGVVSQEPCLFNTTIEQNIRYGRNNVADAEIVDALKKANAYDFVNSFPKGLQTLVGDRGVQMSGGQKQRIAIARALVRNPKILLLDEATSALDAESEHVVQRALENASRGRTTIVVAHRLSTIRNADQIIVMKGGEIMEVGKHDDLLKKKRLYHELLNAQVFADVDTPLSSPTRPTLSVDYSKKYMSQESHISTARDGEIIGQPAITKDIERLRKELEEEGAVRANLLRIMKYARPEYCLMLIGTVAALLHGMVMPAFSLFFSQIIEVFSNPDREQMVEDGHFWALMFLVLAAFQGTTMFLQCSLFGIASERLTMRIRSKVFRNVLRQDATYFDMPTHAPGRITTRLATDVPNVKAAIDHRLASVFNGLVATSGGIIISFYYGWQMALLVVSIFPLTAAAHSFQTKYYSRKASSEAKQQEQSGKIAMEAIENIKSVQALTIQSRLHAQFCSFLDGHHRTNKVKALIQGIANGLSGSIFFFLSAISFRFGLFLIFNESVRMPPMNVLRVLFGISFSFSTIDGVAAYFSEYTKATFAAGLIFKMLEEEPMIDGMSENGTKPKINGEIKFEKVYFRYPERPEVPILRGLDISVHPGETLALVGPSGCGKSTVISLLERLYDPLDGNVLVDNNDLRGVNPKHLRKHIALVSQEPILFDISIRENIAYGLNPGEYSDADIIEAAKKSNIHSFVESLPNGYETRVGEKGTQLSGGQKQRIAIARALIRKPKILLLDEATSALDTENEKQVQEALDAASQGRTCIVVAHRLSTIVNANCIMVVKEGVVVEKGTHAELMAKRGAYYDLTLKQSNHNIVN
ncbi:unnamed protein product [Caenorhabditis bovis]|uniref:Uncharacterized protein n=1 Tax=Caenorhabditis bovis TaxID=2654633 RepID=A0A8S1EE62_9PELO|nr:unnamed protein product [Caenorhabditis bovis]